MEIKLITFGIAREIINSKHLPYTIKAPATLGDLKAKLIRDYPAFASLASISFAVDEEYRSDDYSIESEAEIVIIPPVAGG